MAAATIVKVTQQAVATWIEDFTKICQENNFVNGVNFDPPLYNVWTKAAKSNDVSHFGNSEATWVTVP